MSDIVVGYDGSECGANALEQATQIAKELGDTIVLVFSYEINRLGGEVKDMADALREQGEKILAEGSEKVRNAGVSVETELAAEIAPADALAELAIKRKARLIAVGTHGDSPIKGAILGSTPHKLLHISESPVLVVPAR